ncbi:phage adaptor protein [Bradyrhizobium sp. USDA 4350]
MTLGDLKTQFKGLLNNSVVSKNDALVTTFINQAIMRIQRELRVPFMEKQILYTIPTGYTKLAIPSDLLELIALMVDTDADGVLEYEMRRSDLTRVVSASQIPGATPRIFTRQGGSWILGPMPSVGSQVLIHYYAEFAPVAADTDTNTCLKVAWDAVLYGALSAATDYLQDDERGPKFEGRYTQITKQLQDQADADELTADAVMAPALQMDQDEW